MRLKDLSYMSDDELELLFDDSATPELGELAGEYKGVLLAGQIRGEGKWFSIRFVNQPWFPWKGKVFDRASGPRGKGGNRFEVAGRHFVAWPFETAVTESRFGGSEVVRIDYDIPEAAAWQRGTIFDEIRRVEDDLYIGKGGVSLGGAELFVFLWAIAPVDLAGD